VRWLAVVAVVTSIAACSGDDLEGSVLQILPDLSTYTSVQVSIDPGTALAVSYLRAEKSVGADAGVASEDTVFKITINLATTATTEAVKLVPHQAADLTPDFTGLARADCSRSVANDPRHAFAPIQIGQFTVNQAPVATQPLSGSFRVTFGADADGGCGAAQLGEGRTAFGSFTTNEVVTAVGL
jgi:hypothetical protein